jgi:type IV secretion system protein TrbC
MPWEEPLQQVLESVQGPVAKIVAVIIIIVTGLTLAFGETAGGFRRLIQIVFGLSIAFAASSFFLSFFSFGGGALIAFWVSGIQSSACAALFQSPPEAKRCAARKPTDRHSDSRQAPDQGRASPPGNAPPKRASILVVSPPRERPSGWS